MNRRFEQNKIFLGKDGSLRWWARILILLISFCFALLVAKYGREPIVGWLGEDLKDNDIFSSAVTLGLFGVIFGLGNWIIKNHDVKKQFKDTFIGQNEMLFSNAVQALFDRTPNENAVNIHGFKEIARLFREELIDLDRINAVTGAGHDLSGANLKNAVLTGFNLRSVKLIGAILEGADLRQVDFRYAKLNSAKMKNAVLSGAVLRGANLSGVNLRNTNLRGANLEGAIYDGKTQFPETLNPEKRRLKKV